MSELDRIAAHRDIVRSYRALDGAIAHAPDEAVLALLNVLGADIQSLGDLPAPPENWPPPPEAPEGASCFLPEFLERGRAWGVTCQLYGLRSQRNWGIGDFEDLAGLGEILAPFGADFVGLNPLHALFLAEPQKASPFSPSDRNFVNPLYIAVDHVEGFDPREDADETALSALRQAHLVDYTAVARHKLTALGNIHRRTRHARPEAFHAFVDRGGEHLNRFALFEALSLHMVREGFYAGWMSWPIEYRDPDNSAVAAFARDHADEVHFQLWLQWLADTQLRAASDRLKAADMRIGLYLDLAVGTAPDGAATWRDRTLTKVGAEIGAPPDMFNPDGQSWGLAPVSPWEMTARDFRPVRRAYESILCHAGALRIDHAMSLYRLFWIPAGFRAADGAYLLYPMPEILRVLADVSQKTRALIIGEDLGVVPEGFRAQMARADVLGYRIFYFERDETGFVPPEHWPRSVLACVGSHDTSTLAGWWRGKDVDVRLEIGLYDEEAARRERERRSLERREAIDLLHARGHRRAGQAFDETVAAGIHHLVASAPSRLMAAQMEDLLGLVEQPNIPGTMDEHPNWRRKLPVPLEKLDRSPMLHRVLDVIARERPRSA